MNARLKVPYNYSDPDHDFDHSREFVFDGTPESLIQWKKIKSEYETTMVNTYKKYKPVIDLNIRRLGQNIASIESVKEKTNFKSQKTYFTDTKAIVRNEENKEIYIEELLDHYKKGDMFVLDIQLPEYKMNDELEPEVKAWMQETYKINTNNELTDEEKVTGFTKRDLKLEFEDGNSTALLKDTKLIDIVNNHTFAFLVGEIIFLNN